MLRVLFATVVIAVAASLPASAQEKWSGFYLGGNGGYGFGQSSTESPDSVFNPASFPPGGSGKISFHPKGAVYGAQVGFNAQTGQFVYGVEFERSLANVEKSYAVGTNVAKADYEGVSSVTGRLGLTSGNVLFYVKGGYAFANITNFAIDNADTIDNTTVSRTARGLTLGAGVEFKLTGAWSARGEFQHYDFNDAHSTNSDTDRYTHKNTLDVVKFGLNYRFGP
jgi:outer membrane immunogenic protein